MSKSSTVEKKAKKRKYSEDYVKYGFTYTIRDGIEVPQCFLCSTVFCNDNMRPGKLKEHFDKMHPENSKDTLEQLKNKKARHSTAGTLVSHGFVPTEKPLLHASFKVAYNIAKNKKPHTIGETLIKPCALEMVEIVLGKEQMKKVAKIPLSNNVIQDRIVDISSDLRLQVMEDIETTDFPVAFQFDESTDVSQCSQLLGFVKYFFYHFTILTLL